MSPENSSPIGRNKDSGGNWKSQSLIQYKGRMDSEPCPAVARTNSGVGVMKQRPDPRGMLHREHLCHRLDWGSQKALHDDYCETVRASL